MSCVSPQGSVEAQCGLVLNGQGGVIRRGKGAHPFILSLSYIVVYVPEAVNTPLAATHDKTARQTDKQAEHCSLVCCQHVTAGAGPPFSRLFKHSHTVTRAQTLLPFSSMKWTVTQTPTGFFLFFTSHSKHWFFFIQEIKMSTSHELIWQSFYSIACDAQYRHFLFEVRLHFKTRVPLFSFSKHSILI